MSHLLQLANIPSNHPSDVITNVLGGGAVLAFLVIALYIGYQVMNDSSKRKKLAAMQSMESISLETKREEKQEKPKKEESIDAVNEYYDQVYHKIIDDAREKLEPFVESAQQAFERTADGYASNSIGHEGENHAVRSKKFMLVCERQWGAFRSDMPYASYLDVQEQLKHILANHRMLNETKQPDNDDVDLNPEMLRSRELVALMRVVSRDRVKIMQDQMLKAVGVFRNDYLDTVSSWINDQIGTLKTEMRPRKGKKYQISDTDYLKKFKSLKTRLELVARLTEWITENAQQMHEASLAMSQVIHVGTVLRIISMLPEWFEDLGMHVATNVESGAAK